MISRSNVQIPLCAIVNRATPLFRVYNDEAGPCNFYHENYLLRDGFQVARGLSQ